jgi:hypothetical protein
VPAARNFTALILPLVLAGLPGHTDMTRQRPPSAVDKRRIMRPEPSSNNDQLCILLLLKGSGHIHVRQQGILISKEPFRDLCVLSVVNFYLEQKHEEKNLWRRISGDALFHTYRKTEPHLWLRIGHHWHPPLCHCRCFLEALVANSGARQCSPVRANESGCAFNMDAGPSFMHAVLYEQEDPG